MRSTLIACILLVTLAACSGDDDECAAASECIDGDLCTEDRCTNGQCTYLPIEGCCTSDADCAPGTYCAPETSRCTSGRRCTTDADCDDEEPCTIDTCGDDDLCANQEIEGCPFTYAGPCLEHGHCLSGYCLSEAESGMPGGYCARACHSDPECPAGLCALHSPDVSLCVPTCTASSQCRYGFNCLINLDISIGICLPRCLIPEQCPHTGICNPWLGLCTTHQGPRAVGEPCESDADCNGHCITEAENGFPGGMCASGCVADAPGCPEGTRCVLPFLSRGAPYPRCLPEILAPAACREHYVPWPTYDIASGGTEEVWVCQPACDAGGCQPQTPCNLHSGLCGHPDNGAGVTGDPCDGPEGCRGFCNDMLPGGYCHRACNPAVPTCPDGSACFPFGLAGLCIAPCDGDADCRHEEGYVCRTEGGCWLPP
jgi:hypothetical protein